MTKTAVFNFSKPSEGSTIASSRIALFLAETIKAPLFYDGTIADQKLDTLFIVNGAFAFCKYLPEIGAAVTKAKRIIWVQNDYSIKAPTADSAAESPFRKAFRTRTGEPVHYWTTVGPMAVGTPFSRYINWNSLTYEPLEITERAALRSRATKDLFYYGAYRQNREAYFSRYFRGCPVDVTVSSVSSKFTERYGSHVVTYSGINRGGFFQDLASHGLGLYIEDRKSHVEFHSPANRFYEMLSAGLPMVFQPESVGMLAKVGLDVRPFVLTDMAGLPKLMKRREAIGAEQRGEWSADYVGKLRKTVLRAYKELL